MPRIPARLATTSRRGLLVAAAVLGVGVAAAASTVTGNDRRPIAPPPFIPAASPTPTTVADPPLVGGPVGELDTLPAVPPGRRWTVAVLYDDGCQPYRTRFDLSATANLVPFAASGACGAAWSRNGRYTADAGAVRGVAVVDLLRHSTTTVAETLAIDAGSVRLDDAGDVAFCATPGRGMVVRRGTRALLDIGQCPVALRPDGRTLALAPSGDVVDRTGHVVIRNRDLPGGEVAAIGVAANGRAIAVLGSRGNAPWARTFRADGTPLARADDIGGGVISGNDGAPSVDVTASGRVAVTRHDHDVRIVRLAGVDSLSLDSVARETVLDASLAPDGSLVAVATRLRLVLLDSATLAPVAAPHMPFAPVRVDWLDLPVITGGPRTQNP